MKKKKTDFETQFNELNAILEVLKNDDLKVSEIKEKVLRAKEIYELCKKELEGAKMEIEEIDVK